MRYTILTTTIFLMTCLTFSTGLLWAGQPKITLATLDWEPYVGKNLKDQGCLTVIVKEAFERSGIDLDIQFHQWSRVVGLAKKAKIDGYFPEYYADSITAYASFSDPIPAGPLGFFKLKETTIRFSTLEDLKGYRIGIVKGYINSHAFDTADFLEKHPVNDDLTNLRLLLARRVDLMVADKFVGFYLTRRHLSGHMAEIEFMPTILEQKNVYVCISNKTGKHSILLNAFNRGLETMRTDHTLARMLSGLASGMDTGGR